MKRALILAMLAACGGDEPTVYTPCVGDHEGSFKGDVSGKISGSLDEDGLLTATFQTEFGPLGSAAQVSPKGEVDDCASGVCIQGTYDFDSCSISGTWNSDSLGVGGKWDMAAL